LKSGSLNLLEPSGLAQTCNGIALPFRPVASRYTHYAITGAVVVALNRNVPNLKVHYCVYNLPARH